MPTPPLHPPRARRTGAARVTGLAATLVVTVLSTLTIGTGVAAADAPHGVGLTNITTNGFTHPWQGGWSTNVGTAWCIDTGSWDPRATGNTAIGDLPASRSVSAKNRNALAYALWAYSATNDSTTAGGLATVVHGLSGDSYASTNVPSMTVSNAGVYNAAVSIYNQAEARAFWVGTWHIAVTLTFNGGTGWTSTVKVTASNGAAVAGVSATVVPYNVVASQHPGTARTATTDANGEIHSSWTQADTTQPITVDAAADAPGYYNVWQGPAYSEGPAAQKIITGTGTRYSGRGQATIPSGFGRVRKVTTNPAYQSAAGATYDVQSDGGGSSLGTLTVGADGNSNTLSLPVGTYQAVETSAPAGVRVDPTPHRFTVTAQSTATLALSDEVDHQAELDLLKVDAITYDPVAGATLTVSRDDNGDGTYETTVGTFTTTTEPVKVDGLEAGNYQITETAPPPGYLAPKVATKNVALTWDQTTTVSFDDHKIPTITTHSQLANGDGAPIASSAPSDLSGSANVVGAVGSTLHDVATVTGLGDDEQARVTSTLYGPVQPGEHLVCDADHQVWSGTWTITGSGDSTSDGFTPTQAGLYGYVETLDVPGVGQFSGTCGEITETSILTPTISTKAQKPQLKPGATVHDVATITGLTDDQTGTVTTTLYGPFASADALAKACAAGQLGTPVGTVDYQVTGSGASTSPSITLPAGDVGAGVYTFVETLRVPGFPPITHDCGTPPETFTVPHPPKPVAQPTSGAAAGDSTNGGATLPATGAAIAALGALGVALFGIGLATVFLTDRRTVSST